MKKSLAESQQLLKTYEWTETTFVNFKGEEKSKTVKPCSHGADGEIQKADTFGGMSRWMARRRGDRKHARNSM